MEPDREQQRNSLVASGVQKPKRFRIVKLEERIAPAKGGRHSNYTCLAYECPSSPIICPSARAGGCQW
jgi:hypothetical protein